jgi:hypothetical protein
LAQKLGKIEKPQVTDFRDARKLFCLPLVPQFTEKDLDNDLKNSIEQFWSQVSSQIADLERTGKISHIFFESITKDGKLGLEMVKKVSQQSYDIIKEKIDKGAKLVLIENDELLNEFLDWSICLSVIRKSQKVFNQVLEFHQEVKDRRNKEIAKKIDETLKNNESGLLVMTDENRLQIQPNLPSDIQVFLIHPPALNDIMRWLRDYWKKQSQT